MKITKEYLTQDRTCFHAETEKEADWLLKKANYLGLKWYNGDSYLEEKYWNTNRYYDFKNGKFGNTNMNRYKKTIIKVKDIMKEEKQIKITKENAIQMKDSGIESLVELAKTNYPEIFEEKWDRDALNDGSKYYYFNRDFRYGFGVIADDYIGAILSHTYETKELAEKEAKMFNLMQEIRAFTRWANEKDGFVADWSHGSDQKKFVLSVGLEIDIHYYENSRSGLFQCYFATEERAEECLSIFEKDIKEVFEL